ncbi:hypothetical protein M514_07281 [Trichuris suis]|uniref:RNA-directed DNA polymerase n=1 Tax=Trichuris suis TaxID=68888 RepID=A0A085MRU5_9BILA|nr:hypothetical protein M514_07281 [Trichuris suis]
MEVAPASRKYLVIATHKGYYRFKRLPFGVSFAPALFQKTMEQFLAGLEGVAVYIDDIIVSGANREEHMERLHAVFLRLRHAGVRVHAEKCRFLQFSVNYLGHRIDANGVHPTGERIEAIKNMPVPKNTQELRSFLGVVNYYARFIPRLQPLCAPLYELIKTGSKWSWGKQHKQLFDQLRRCLSSSDTLVHYDENLPLVLYTDACDCGLGAVLRRTFNAGTEKPIAFASRLLTDVEKRYSKVDKEALGIVFGVTKFAQYLYGRRFTLKTDHKPLERILGDHRELPIVATNRLSRWALILGTYEYTVEYVAGNRNAPADALSRLAVHSVDVTPTELQRSGQLLNIRLADLPVTKQQLRQHSLKDAQISDVIKYLERGWPCRRNDISEEIRPFAERREELSYEDRILLWQGRIVIPKTLRPAVLQMIHDGHPGICAMKSIARFYVWWPGLDSDIERYVRNCSGCQENQARPPEVPLFSWNMPSEPWTRLHVDLAGPFKNLNWFVIVDAYSKWLDVIPLRNTLSATIIKHCRRLFATFGLPRYIVSDNGPQFVSEEFTTFCRSNNIVHVRTTPYHPKTNGLAERAVRTFKERLAKAGEASEMELCLQRFLFSYRNTPHATTGRSPAELLIGRRLRNQLDLLKPSLESTVDIRTFKQAGYHDRKARPRVFQPGEKVLVSQHRGGSQKGVVIDRTAENSYRVECNGTVQRKHADQLRRCDLHGAVSQLPDDADGINDLSTEGNSSGSITPQNEENDSVLPQACHTCSGTESDGCGSRTRPKRSVRAPVRPYGAYLDNPKLK